MMQLMRAGEDFDYFFEVDGERRYDFECEFNSIEVLDRQTAFQASMMPLMPGQTIIVNQIQICEKEEDDNTSTCSSSNSSASNNDNNNSWESNPTVSWPEDCLALMDMKKDKSKMVLAKKPMPAAVEFRKFNSCDVNTCSSSCEGSYYRGYQDSYYQQKTTTHQQKTTTHQDKKTTTKRVHFWDMPYPVNGGIPEPRVF